MRKRPAGPKTTLFYAIVLTMAAIAFISQGASAPKWGALLFLVLAGHSWYVFFKMVSKKR